MPELPAGGVCSFSHNLDPGDNRLERGPDTTETEPARQRSGQTVLRLYVTGQEHSRHI